MSTPLTRSTMTCFAFRRPRSKGLAASLTVAAYTTFCQLLKASFMSRSSLLHYASMRPNNHLTLPNKSVFNFVNSLVNKTLSAFAAERRAAAPLLLSAGACRCRLIWPARWALSSKPAACRSGCRTMGQTDGRTDGWTDGPRPLNTPCSAYYTGSVDIGKV